MLDRLEELDGQPGTDFAATPWHIIRALELELGAFDLDPCATPLTAKAPKFYTPDVDGLTQTWTGRVFCNPPYSRKVAWIKKAQASANAGAMVVLLLPARLESAWFRELIRGRAEVRLLPFRVDFTGPNGESVRPRDGCMVVIFRPLGAWRIG